MSRKIFLRKSSGVWKIETAEGFLLSEKRIKSSHDALLWCKNWLSSYHETFDIEVVDDKRKASDEKTAST
jgi:hypothetical protein